MNYRDHSWNLKWWNITNQYNDLKQALFDMKIQKILEIVISKYTTIDAYRYNAHLLSQKHSVNGPLHTGNWYDNDYTLSRLSMTNCSLPITRKHSFSESALRVSRKFRRNVSSAVYSDISNTISKDILSCYPSWKW